MAFLKSFKTYLIEEREAFSLAQGQAPGVNYDWDPNYRHIGGTSTLNPLVTGDTQTALGGNTSMLHWINLNLLDGLPNTHPHYSTLKLWLEKWTRLAVGWYHVPEANRIRLYNQYYREYTQGWTNTSGTVTYPPIQQLLQMFWPQNLAVSYNKDMTGNCIFQYPNSGTCYYGSNTPSG